MRLAQHAGIAGADSALYQEGMLVNLASKPEWGPGKIVHSSGDKLFIIFRDLNEDRSRTFRADSPNLRISEVQSDAILDNLPPLKERGGNWILPAPRLSFEDAKKMFYKQFPLGFQDPGYLIETKEKRDAHEKASKVLSLDIAKELLQENDVSALVKIAFSILGRVGFLLSRFENAAFHDAMQDMDAARKFFEFWIQVLDATEVTEESFSKYCDAVLALPEKKGGARVASWPVATVLLYVLDPTRHILLKPDITKRAADSLGFDLHYDPIPNWTTYEALLRMCKTYLEFLQPLGAKDFIDVQSFIYVAGGGY